MSIASVLLQTSLLEGMPNSVMKAQALGLPVVATRLGGTADCVKDSVTGHLCSAEEREGLVPAVLKVLSNDAHAARLRKAGMEAGRRFLTKERMAARMIQAALARARSPVDTDKRAVAGTPMARAFRQFCELVCSSLYAGMTTVSVVIG
jgi:glycosyltransferase involved in cell wall biosynthesis